MKYSYGITGMMGDTSVDKVGVAVRRIAGISNLNVTLDPPRLQFDADHALEPNVLLDAVKSAGHYTVTEDHSYSAKPVMSPEVTTEKPYEASLAESKEKSTEPDTSLGEAAPQTLYPMALIAVGLVVGLTLTGWVMISGR